MKKFLVETYYTCTFKIVHELSELNEKELSDIDNRKDGRVEVIDVTVNNRKTKRSDGKNDEGKTNLNDVKVSHVSRDKKSKELEAHDKQLEGAND